MDCTLIGTLAAAPTLSAGKQTGRAVARCTLQTEVIAHNASGRTRMVEITAIVFGGRAETLAKLPAGERIIVQGELGLELDDAERGMRWRLVAKDWQAVRDAMRA